MKIRLFERASNLCVVNVRKFHQYFGFENVLSKNIFCIFSIKIDLGVKIGWWLKLQCICTFFTFCLACYPSLMRSNYWFWVSYCVTSTEKKEFFDDYLSSPNLIFISLTFKPLHKWTQFRSKLLLDKKWRIKFRSFLGSFWPMSNNFEHFLTKDLDSLKHNCPGPCS